MTALALLLSFTLQAGPTSASAPVSPSTADYQVGAQDVLLVTVFQEPTLTGRYTVDSDGTFSFPWIGRVTAGGKTVRNIEEELTRRLREGYLVQPEVSVDVEQYRSKSVFIVGEVRTPGKYALTGQMTLLEAISAAGSVTGGASAEIHVIHPKEGAEATGPVLPDGEAEAEVETVLLADLQSGRVENVRLQDGDTIYVPKAGSFFVSGHVRSPGSYVLQPGMTVLQALSLAGGITDRGSDRRIKITRVVDGKRQEIGVKLTDLVESGDTIVVPQRFF